MNYEIIQIDGKTVAGLITKTTNENMKAVEDIEALWQKFFSTTCAEIKGKTDNKLIGIYTDYEGDFTMPYNFIAGCEVSNIKNIQPSLVVRKIPFGKYAKFSGRGNYQSVVAEMWKTIWNTKLDRKYSYDFEVYHCNSEDMNDQIIDIYISLVD